MKIIPFTIVNIKMSIIFLCKNYREKTPPLYDNKGPVFINWINSINNFFLQYFVTFLQALNLKLLFVCNHYNYKIWRIK